MPAAAKIDIWLATYGSSRSIFPLRLDAIRLGRKQRRAKIRAPNIAPTPSPNINANRTGEPAKAVKTPVRKKPDRKEIPENATSMLA